MQVKIKTNPPSPRTVAFSSLPHGAVFTSNPYSESNSVLMKMRAIRTEHAEVYDIVRLRDGAVFSSEASGFEFVLPIENVQVTGEVNL